MDAELFQRVYDALEDGSKKVVVLMRHPSPISKLVWSSFNYRAGPELDFTWEAHYTGDGISDGKEGRLDSSENVEENKMEVSSDSSLSKNTNECGSTLTANDPYEEIDTFHLVDELPHCSLFEPPHFGSGEEGDLESSALFSSCHHDSYSSRYKWPAAETSSSQLSTDGTESTPKHALRDSKQFDMSSTSLQQQQREHRREEATVESSLLKSQMGTLMTTSVGVDSGIAATISVDSELSSASNYYCQPVADHHDDAKMGEDASRHRGHGSIARYCVASSAVELEPSCSSSTTVTPNATLATGCCALAQCEEALPEKKEGSGSPYCSPTMLSSGRNTELATSLHNNNQAGGNMAASPVELFDKEAELLAELMGRGREASGCELSDEEFIAKSVLAEQICSAQLASNPLIHKFCIVPPRRIAVSSYIFSLPHAKPASSRAASPTSIAAMTAFSLVFPIESADWYMERQPVFERILTDLVPRFKVAQLVESVEDLVYRLTRDFISILELFGALERWPLSIELSRMKIQSSHLWDRCPRGTDMVFLAKAVTACLICKGQCAVVGSEQLEVYRYMLTLTLFLAPDGNGGCEQRILSLIPPRESAHSHEHHPFSPYLCVQQVKRSDLESGFYALAAEAHWPVALVDVDRRSVCYTGSYARHKALKRSYQLHQLGSIIRDANAENGHEALAHQPHSFTPLQLELQVVRADGDVLALLESIFTLPLERAARYAYIDHFHLRLENRARALLVYVEEASRPTTSGDKRTALASKWSLVVARKALSLQHESIFGMVLARADSLRRGGFAELMLATASGTGMPTSNVLGRGDGSRRASRKI